MTTEQTTTRYTVRPEGSTAWSTHDALTEAYDAAQEARNQGLRRVIIYDEQNRAIVRDLYAIQIKACHPGAYKWSVGWDDVYTSEAEAEQAASRAERNDGWSARVIRLA